MQPYVVWWGLAAILVGAELLTGTFYLLVIGGAFAVGGALAWAGAGLPWQLAITAILAVAGTFAAHRWRRGRGSAPSLPGLDVGHEVRVEEWRSDGRARVAYRGSQWDARTESAATPRGERMFIASVRGNVLILSDRPPAG